VTGRFASLADHVHEGAQPAVPKWRSPGDLAKAINPKTTQTPALDVVDAAVIEAFSTPDARLIISMSPQEGKSERVTKTGALYALINNPDLRIAIISFAQSLAERFGGEIRDWITSNNGDEGSLDLGLRINRDNGARSRWRLDGRLGGVYSVGISGGLTGRAVDAMIIDDPFSGPEQADVKWYRDKVWDWWRAVGSTRLAPGAPVIVIMTRWHEDDLAGRLIAAEDGHLWKVISIPALADHDPAKGQTDPLGRKPGEWMVSARGRTVAEWEAIRVSRGSRVFNALYQGRPSPETGDVWKRSWWRRYDTMLWTVGEDGEYRVDCDEMILSWDMAFKDTKSSDFVVGQVWARKGASVYLLDQVHKRLSFTDTIAAFQAQVRLWPQATAKLVEDKANGTAVIDTLKSKLAGIVAISPTESKYSRANAVSPFIEAGNVYLPTAEVGLFDAEALIEEAAAFPNGAHDDQVDAASQALSRLLLDTSGAAAWIDYFRRQNTAPAETEPEPIRASSPHEARQAAFRNRQYQ
jgi:predicted phage terminase large subunit-like protein